MVHLSAVPRQVIHSSTGHSEVIYPELRLASAERCSGHAQAQWCVCSDRVTPDPSVAPGAGACYRCLDSLDRRIRLEPADFRKTVAGDESRWSTAR